jgi:hypothetical protein
VSAFLLRKNRGAAAPNEPSRVEAAQLYFVEVSEPVAEVDAYRPPLAISLLVEDGRALPVVDQRGGLVWNLFVNFVRNTQLGDVDLSSPVVRGGKYAKRVGA